MLNRSTARSARAGSRFAALRRMWLSIMPPWVGSGCRQTSVATGSLRGRPGQLADQVEAVRGVQGDRLPPGRQDRTRPDLAHRFLPCLSDPGLRRPSPAPGPPPYPLLPARPVPVPPPGRARELGGPGDQVRCSGRDFLITSWATIALGRRWPRHQPDHPVPVRPRLKALRPAGRGAGSGGRRVRRGLMSDNSAWPRHYRRRPRAGDRPPPVLSRGACRCPGLTRRCLYLSQQAERARRGEFLIRSTGRPVPSRTDAMWGRRGTAAAGC